MSEDTGKQIHPVRIPDRRLRALSRPNASDRRQSPRYQVDFPVDIVIGSGPNQQIIHARASDISDGGLRLASADIPAGHEKLKLRFHMPEGVMPEEYVVRDYELNGTVRAYDPAKHQIGVQFDEQLSTKLSRTTWAYFLWSSVIVFIVTLSLVLLTKYESLYYFWFDVPVFLYTLSVGAFLVSRFLFAACYRPPKPRSDKPLLTLLIPTHNEETYIERTIRQVFESDYPVDKLQVIAINDGSTDDTLAAMHRAKQKYPDLILIHFEEPQGKRQALAAGTRMATGEIIVFTDSDSFIYPDALSKIIDGFADPDVAAVTGHCEVENTWVNTLTKIQAVRYFIGFRIMKAAESIFDTVTCLSGPLSAYRREPLLDILDGWVNQSFLGQPATFGDDRSLTNKLIRRGWKLKYDSRARTSTMVPQRQGTFLRQQMRWKRSWFRESLKACFFIWKRQPLMWLSFYVGFLISIFSPAIVFRALLYNTLLHQSSPAMYHFCILMMSSLMSAAYLLAKRSRLWVYGVFFCYYYLLVLVWQLPWAILTFWVPRWGTRQRRKLDYEGVKC